MNNPRRLRTLSGKIFFLISSIEGNEMIRGLKNSHEEYVTVLIVVETEMILPTVSFEI
jgi:hypothetical protein